MQQPLGFDPSYLGLRDWEQEREWAVEVIRDLQAKVVAALLNIGESTLSEAVREKRDQGIKAEWMAVIVRAASPKAQAEYVALVTRRLGFEMPKRIAALTEGEELRMTRELLKTRAPLVLEAIDRELGK